MSQSRIEALRGAFKNDAPTNNDFNNNYYPFWNMKEGESAVFRFLPDLDETNPLAFMKEKLMHNLDIDGERKKVPCLKMYGEDCPICKVSQKFYKVGDKANGKKYWRQKQHVIQALIIEDPLPPGDDLETHEGKVRFMTLGFQIYNIVKDAFESGELDEVPYDLENGYNFTIKKTKQGEYPSYNVGTNFARKQTSLDADQIVITETGMVELSTLIPKNPGLELVENMLAKSMGESEE